MKIEMFRYIMGKKFRHDISNGIFKTLINYCVTQLDHCVGKFKF